MHLDLTFSATKTSKIFESQRSYPSKVCQNLDGDDGSDDSDGSDGSDGSGRVRSGQVRSGRVK